MKKSSVEDISREVLVRLGRKIRDRRRSIGWTQEVFAERANINDKEVSHIEQGNRNITIETLVKISAALDVPAFSLIME